MPLNGARVLSFRLTDSSNEKAARRMISMWYGEQAYGGQVFVMPTPKLDKKYLDAYYNRIDKYYPVNKNLTYQGSMNDRTLREAIEEWLTTGNLPTTIKGVPTEQHILPWVVWFIYQPQ